jgi:acetylornithine/N-succinyldiaminopimelate aminotransferase
MVSQNLMPCYNRAPQLFVRGEGVWIYDDSNTAYLDCVGGIATNGLGHAHPKLAASLTEQAGKLWHVSNMFRVEGQEQLAAKLVAQTFADAVFFCNSGSEAVEGSLKAARRYHTQNGAPERINIIGFTGSFHGRSYAAVNASGNPSYLDGFGPRLPGYIQLKVADHDALKAQIADPATAAVIVEPVQGEGGAIALPGACLKGLRELCSAHGVLLIYDEVQSGMGRTGKLFAHQWFDQAEPDIMAIAKALGGGFPVGAFLMTDAVAKTMGVGTHGSTFGGNPLAMAVANTAFDLIADPTLLDNAVNVSDHLRHGLQQLMQAYPELIAEVRGKGMLIGLKLIPNNRQFLEKAREHKLLIAAGGDNCVRLLPPLNMTTAEADQVVARLRTVCEVWSA